MDNNYKIKLNQSYKICVDELKCPHPHWEEHIMTTKFTIDSITRKPKTHHIFVLDHSDNITTTSIQHTYVFKRSQFYQKFQYQNSRIRQELTQYYAKRNYTCNLYKDTFLNKWCLQISWKDD
jgi:LPS O-antigen subunit length determinant protein (WzzB/FepE family)